MRIDFRNLHTDGEVRTSWDIKLAIVGEFGISSGDHLLYRVEEFCVVEFALALSKWLARATDRGPNFVYTSLESEIEGLVRFSRQQPGLWNVSAVHPGEGVELILPGQLVVTTAELKKAVTGYLRRLREAILPDVDLLNVIQDSRVRRFLQTPSDELDTNSSASG